MCLFSAVVFFCADWRIRSQVSKFNTRLPWISGYLPIIGHSLYFMDPSAVHQFYVDKMLPAQFSHAHRTALMGFELASVFIQTSNPDLVKKICVSEYQSFGKPSAIYDPVKFMIGDGLVTSGGARWKRNRHLIAPIFAQGKLNGVSDKMQQQVSSFISHKYAMRGDAFVADVDTDFKHLTLSVAVAAILGGSDEDTRLFGDKWTVFIRESFTFLALMLTLGERLGRKLQFLFPRLEHRREEVRAVCRMLIERKQQELQSSSMEGDAAAAAAAAATATATAADNILSMLLEAKDEHGDVMQQDDIVDEVMTFSFAAFDTTSSLLAFMFYELAQHQEVQRKVQEEVDALYAARSAATAGEASYMPSVADVRSLTYLNQVVNETLRLHPPVEEVDKESLVDVPFGDGMVIPAGTLVGIDIIGLHMDPQYWPQPERFMPERWNDLDATKTRYHFAPFSVGSRDCIGKNLALVEAPMIAATLLRHFSVRTCAETKLVYDTNGVTHPKDLKLLYTARSIV